MLSRRVAGSVGESAVVNPQRAKRCRAAASVSRLGEGAKLPAITPERAISNIRVAGCTFQIFVFATMDPKIAEVGKTPEKRNRVAFRSHEGANHPRIKILEAPRGLSKGTVINEDDWCKPGDPDWNWVDKLAALILHSYALHSRIIDDCRVLSTTGHDKGHNSYALKQARYVYDFYSDLFQNHPKVLGDDFEVYMSGRFGDFYKIQSIYLELQTVVDLGIQDPVICTKFDELKKDIYEPCKQTTVNMDARLEFLRKQAAREAASAVIAATSGTGVVVAVQDDGDSDTSAAESIEVTGAATAVRKRLIV